MMYTSSLAERLLNLVGWIIGIGIALVVSVSLATQAIVIPYMPTIVTSIVGWFLLVLTLLGILLAFITHRTS